MEQIRISRGIEVCVNDKDETINLNIDNAIWIDNFIKWLEKAKNAPLESNLDKESLEETIATVKELLVEMDELFNDNASAKVFGEGVIPTPLNLAEFINQIYPIIANNADNRQKKLMEKYSKGRKGGRK